MISLLTILIVVAGFLAGQYLHHKHIIQLEFMLKAKTPQEAKELAGDLISFKKPKEKIVEQMPDNLLDTFSDLDSTAEEIHAAFRRSA